MQSRGRSMSASHTALGAALRRARRDKDLTQDQIARLIGVDPTLVSQWETGRKAPPAGRLAALAEVLALDAKVLVRMRAQYDEAHLDLKRRAIHKRLEEVTSQVREAPAPYQRTPGPLRDELERLSAKLEKLAPRIRSEILRSLRRQIDAALLEQADSKRKDRDKE
jgi:transcriptional regulator with XRE-family HTH domain